MGHVAEKPTIHDFLHVLEEHMHSAQDVYPTGAGGVTVTGAAGAWTLGAFTEIIPADTVVEDFDLHWVNVEGVSASGLFELVLYAVEVEICRTRFTVLGTPANVIIPAIRIQTPIFVKNTQVQAKIMNSAGGSESATISVEYHLY
jgi:hypothetical protein